MYNTKLIHNVTTIDTINHGENLNQWINNHKKQGHVVEMACSEQGVFWSAFQIQKNTFGDRRYLGSLSSCGNEFIFG